MEDCAAIILCNTLRLRALHLLLSASLHFGMEQNVAIAIGHAKEGQSRHLSLLERSAKLVGLPRSHSRKALILVAVAYLLRGQVPPVLNLNILHCEQTV
jgi:hypothetical protein